ncbi:hypothetical protein JW859_13350 [bacterium]|nr:hypothetical protein [bacterium]
MAVIKKTEIELVHKFNSQTCRHTLNGHTSVLHCHHYATLYSRLADDCGMLDGRKLLFECAEDSFLEVLCSYYAEQGIDSIEDRIAIAEQYYAVTGLGKMNIKCAGAESGEVELLHSHVDEGWIKKWGKRDSAVNFITCGYIAAVFSAVFDHPARSYTVAEFASLVKGDERSRFNVVLA